MAAESLLIRAKTAVQGLGQALNDVVRTGARATDNSSQVADNWEKAAQRARKAAEYGRETRDWAGARKQAQDAWREAPGQEWRADLLTPASRAQTAGRSARERADILSVEREQFWGQDFGGADAGGAAGGAAGGNALLAASKRALLRFAAPYAIYQGFTGGLPGQKEANATDVATDKLLRGANGWTENFDSLKDTIKNLADSLDIANARFGELSTTVARTAGNIGQLEATKMTYGGIEASRAFGLEEEVIPNWLAEMRWREAEGPRELLPLVGAAVAKAQMPGRSEELLRGILSHTDKMQSSLTRSIDVKAYVDTVTSMSEFASKNGYPGAKGQGAMSMLDRIDQAVANPDSEAKEVFWLHFLEKKGIKDPAAQKIFRAKGLSGNPELLREVPAFIEEFYKTTEQMGKDYKTLSVANLMGLEPHQAMFFEDWAKRGGKGKASDIFPWLAGRGYSDVPIKEDAVPDVGRLFDIATSEYAAAGDWSALGGLGKRYLKDKDFEELGSEPNEKWVDALLRKLMTEGREKTQADASRQTMDTAQRTIEAAGNRLNQAANLMADSTEVFSGSVRELGAALGLMEPLTPEQRERVNEAGERMMGVGSAIKGWVGGAADWFYTNAIKPVGETYREYQKRDQAERAARAAADAATSGAGGGAGAIPPAGDPTGPAAAAGAAAIDPNAIPSGRIGNNARPYLEMVAESARRHRVPPNVLAGILTQESGFNPSRTGAAGEIGIAQIKPGTARLMGLDPEAMRDARQGIDAGARYLRYNYDAYGGDSWTEAVSGYNAGHNSTAIKRGGIPNPHYVNSVLGVSRDYRDVFKEAPATAPTTPVTEPAPTAVPADSGASGPSAGLWGWPRGAPGTGAGWEFPGPLMPMFASIEVVQRTDTGEIAQRDTRKLAAASYPMPSHRAPSHYAEARV